MAERRNIAVIGLGAFGSAIARELVRMGDRVIGIDLDAKVVDTLNGELDAVIQADATDLKVLDHAGLDGCDAVIVAIGDDMQASLLTTMQAMKVGVKHLFVKAQTPEHGQILTAMGVQNLLQPEQAYALRMAQLLHNPAMQDFMNLGNGNYVAAMRTPPAANCRTVSDIDLKSYDLSCVGIDIGERIITALDLGAHPLGVDDRLVLVGKRDDLRRFALTG
ncbi:MAG: TrkA family potassium uptake protein [Litorimonas sp.]